MVNSSTGPKPSPPQRVIGVSQSPKISPATKKAQQQLSNQYGITTFTHSGEVSTNSSGSSSLKTSVNQRIIQEQQRARQANIAQSIRVASLNPAVRANIAKQGVTGSVGNISVVRPMTNFGQAQSNQQIREQLQQLERTKIKEPRFTFGGNNRYAGRSDEAIAQRLAEVPPPTRAERGLQPLQYNSQSERLGKATTQTVNPSQFIGPIQPTIQPTAKVQSGKGLEVFGVGTKQGSVIFPTKLGEGRVVQSLQTQKNPFIGVTSFAQNFAEEGINFGKFVGNIFVTVSEDFARKKPSNPFGEPYPTVSQEGIGGIVKGVTQTIKEPSTVQSGVFKGAPSIQPLIQETSKSFGNVVQQLIEDPTKSGSILFNVAPFGTAKTAIKLTTETGINLLSKTGGRTIVQATGKATLDPSLKRFRDFLFQGEGKTKATPETSPFGTTGGKPSRIPTTPEEGIVSLTRREQATQLEKQAELQAKRFFEEQAKGKKAGTPEYLLKAIKEDTAKGSFAKSSGGSAKSTRQLLKQQKPTTVKDSASAFRQFQKNIAKGSKTTTKNSPKTTTKKTTKTRDDTLFGVGVSGGLITSPLLTTQQPKQTQEPILDQTQRFTFGDQTRNPRPTRNRPLLQGRNIFDTSFTQGSSTRTGGIFKSPAFLLFRGGGSADQPFDNQRDRKFFRIFDVSKKPFGDIKYYVGFQQQSLRPIQEIRGRARRKIAARRPKNIIFDKSFEKLFKL